MKRDPMRISRDSQTRHDHLHSPNRYGVIPTPLRLGAHPDFDGRGTTICLLDSGFYPHPDLTEPKNRILACYDATKDRLSSQPLPEAHTWNWHGTMTSVVAAGNGHLSDGLYRGIAAGASVVLVKVGDHGRITDEAIAMGIAWAIANRDRYAIRILSLSLGGDEDLRAAESRLDRAVEEAVATGLIVVVAAGNAGCTGRVRPLPPANAVSAITVGGYDDHNRLEAVDLDPYCSNYGPTSDGVIKPEIIAPAIWVAAPILPGTELAERAALLASIDQSPDYLLSSGALRLGLTDPTLTPDEIRQSIAWELRQSRIISAHYQHTDGTSFATPIVASVIAQMLEANPRLTPASVKGILIATADRVAGIPLARQGYGRLNARRAVEEATRETHSLGHHNLFAPRVSGDRLLFILHRDEAKTIAIAGDFNDWDPRRGTLSKSPDGLWRIEIPAPPPGAYQYKFLIDGDRWTDDPGNGLKVPDAFGGYNSVLNVSAESSDSESWRR
jgi:serine protease AprX